MGVVFVRVRRVNQPSGKKSPVGVVFVTKHLYHLTQTIDSEVFLLLWDMIGTVCNV